MPLTRSLYSPLNPDKNTVMVSVPRQGKTLKKRLEENNDHKEIMKIILGSDLNFPQDYKIKITDGEPQKAKVNDSVYIMPQYRVSIWGRNFKGHYNLGMYVWKSFWVKKSGDVFNFSPPMKGN